MSRENDALEEINKALKLKPDPFTFCNRCVERMEDLLVAASRDEFLDPDKVKTFNRWSSAAHRVLVPSLHAPEEPTGLWRLLGRVNPPLAPGEMPQDLAFPTAALLKSVYDGMVALSKKKKVSAVLWEDNEDQGTVNDVIENLEQRSVEMYAIAAGGSAGLQYAQKVTAAKSAEKTMLAK